MSWKRCGKKWSWPDLYTGRSEKNGRKSELGKQMSVPRFKNFISRI
jgi:hypothetical protein